MSATGRGVERLANDDYQTPPESIAVFLKHVKVCGRVMEPCAGSGNILEAVRLLPEVTMTTWCELYPSNGSHGTDFLGYRTGPQRYDWIVTNPPFSLACEFIDQSLRIADNVAMLLRLNFLGSQERGPWWQNRLPSAIYALAKRPGFLDREGHRVLGKNGKPGTDACEYGWFVWSQKYSGIHVIG